MKFNNSYNFKNDKKFIVKEISKIDEMLIDFLKKEFNLIKINIPQFYPENSPFIVKNKNQFRTISFDYSNEYKIGSLSCNNSLWRRYALWKYEINENNGILMEENFIERDTESSASSDIQKKYITFEIATNFDNQKLVLKTIVEKIYTFINNIICSYNYKFKEKKPLFIDFEQLELELPHLDVHQRELHICLEKKSFVLSNPGIRTISNKIHNELLTYVYDAELDYEILFLANNMNDIFKVVKATAKTPHDRIYDELEKNNLEHLKKDKFFKMIAKKVIPNSIETKIDMQLLYMLIFDAGHIAEIFPGVLSNEVDLLIKSKKINSL